MGEFAVLLVRQGTVMLADAETIHVSCLSSPWSLDPISHRQARMYMYIYPASLFRFCFSSLFLANTSVRDQKSKVTFSSFLFFFF